jgi:MFS family permease
MSDWPPFEAFLCELNGLVVGLCVGGVIGHAKHGLAGGIVGGFLGATVGPVVARVPRLRRDLVSMFDYFESLGLMLGVAAGLLGGFAINFGWLASIGVAIPAGLAGWFCGWVPSFLRERYLRRILTKETTDSLRARLGDHATPLYQLWPLYQLLIMKELRKRGENIWSDLPLVLTLLASELIDERHGGWQVLRTFFPDLAAKIPDYDPFQTPADCRAKAEGIRAPSSQTRI